MSIDPISLLVEASGALPAIKAALPELITWIRGSHPELDTTPLGSGADAMDEARNQALHRRDE